MEETAVLILAGGKADRLGVLTRVRTKSSLPFGGAYRIIDFDLSNCVHSGLSFIYILAQYFPESLRDHIRIGAPWDLDRRDGGVWILQPYARKDEHNWYRGTADAIWQNIDVIEKDRYRNILVLSGDHIYKMDYRNLMEEHKRSGASLTMAVTRVEPEEASRYGIIELDESGWVKSMEEKPENPTSNIANMGIYLFNRTTLLDRLRKAYTIDGRYDLVFDIIMDLINEGKVRSFRYDGYWRDVGTIKTYYEANMDLITDLPRLDLFDRNWSILTKTYDNPPARVINPGRIHRSLAGSGCIIEGEVEHSVLFSGVRVAKGARISRSIIMKGCYIGQGAVISDAILDKDVRIGNGVVIGSGSPAEIPPHKDMGDGLVVIGKGTSIPAGTVIGKHVLIDPYCIEKHFIEKNIPSGTHFQWIQQ